MDFWGPAGVLSAAVLGAAALLWKIRRDEVSDLRVPLIGTLEEQVRLLRIEIERLRDWRHDFGQKEMVYDYMEHRLESLEQRVTAIERKVE